jgi:xanthosine utilization system XapX-like protein
MAVRHSNDGGKSMKIQRSATMSLVAGLLLGSVTVFVPRAATAPPVFVVIEANEISDAEGFKEDYIKLVPPGVVEAKFADARVLALSQDIIALDGPAPKFIAILALPNVVKAKVFSENMKEIRKTRRKTTKSRSFIVDNANSEVRPF